jgi:solute carrier family 25 oxoglutarate transporter 11
MSSIRQAAESIRSRTSDVMNSVKRSETAAKASDIIHTPVMKAALPFINGGISGMVATTVIQPVDMVKVRIQLAGEGTSGGPKPTALSVTRNIISSGKALDLYTGLSAGLLRQAVYYQNEQRLRIEVSASQIAQLPVWQLVVWRPCLVTRPIWHLFECRAMA